MVPEISLIIPVYKAGNALLTQLIKKIQVLAAITKRYEIILVFDGKDELAEKSIIELQRHGHFYVIKSQRNYGKGHAVRAGMQKAKGKYVAYMDYDNDINPKIIKQMYAAIKKTGSNVILPSKRHELSKVKYSKLRKLYGKIYNFVLRLLFQIECKDTQVGAKMFKADFLRKILPYCEINGFAFEIEIIALAKIQNILTFTEIPVRVNLKTQSSIRMIDGLRVIVDTLKLFFRKKRLAKKFQAKIY